MVLILDMLIIITQYNNLWNLAPVGITSSGNEVKKFNAVIYKNLTITYF